MFNAFADKDENPQLPGLIGDYYFSEQNGITKVRITIFKESQERVERLIETDFKEGFKMTINNLEKITGNFNHDETKKNEPCRHPK